VLDDYAIDKPRLLHDPTIWVAAGTNLSARQK
jgi:hypothetical protein